MTRALFLDKRSLWRVGNGIIFGGIGIYLAWMFWRNYTPYSASSAEYLGIALDLTLVPAAFLLLIAVGILLNKRWSLILAGITLLVFIVVFTFSMLGLIALSDGMTGKPGAETWSSYLWLIVPGLYMATTAYMAFIYARHEATRS